MRDFPVDPDYPGVLQAFVNMAGRHLALSARQSEVLYHLVRGVTAEKDIARVMRISDQTVKNHGTEIRRKGLVSREAAICRAWPLCQRALRLGPAIAPLIEQAAAA